MRSIALSACALLLSSAACRAPAEAPSAPAAAPAPPGSALAGAVRALETVRAVRPEGATTQVRALVSDTRIDPERGLEFERVFLDVTVYAPTRPEAVAGFEALRAALETEARAGARVEPASAERVHAALQEIGALPAGGPELVSYSDRIRLEIRPGASPALEPEPEARLGDGLDSLANYVHERAARADAVGSVVLRPAGERGSDLRCELRPAEPFQRFTLAQIATFLASLENDSPAMRLTRVALEPSQHEPDPASPRRWTFEAELSVRALTPRR